MFSAIKFEKNTLFLLDQRELPHRELWLEFRDADSTADAIKSMVVRGAPAIGCAAAYGLAADVAHSDAKTWGDYGMRFQDACKVLADSRPTAVNLFYAIDKVKRGVAQLSDDCVIGEASARILAQASAIFDDDVRTCRAIGDNGFSFAPRRQLNVLTHCNTGSLATASYGTALGVIRSLHNARQISKVYVDETRPYLQGSRLTAFELAKDGIPFELIADSSAAFLMQKGEVDWVVVGADRIAANGDTANKIGTYSLAVNARYHDVPFFVAAPLSTVDSNISAGSDIPIELRDEEEVSEFRGTQVAPEGSRVYNPSFDVTPSELITGIITEAGVLQAPYTQSIAAAGETKKGS